MENAIHCNYEMTWAHINSLHQNFSKWNWSKCNEHLIYLKHGMNNTIPIPAYHEYNFFCRAATKQFSTQQNILTGLIFRAFYSITQFCSVCFSGLLRFIHWFQLVMNIHARSWFCSCHYLQKYSILQHINKHNNADVEVNTIHVYIIGMIEARKQMARMQLGQSCI